MVYARNPGHSKSKINKAGDALRRCEVAIEYEVARKIVDDWRIAHAYPLHIIANRLRKDAAPFKKSLVAQRLKRLPTIIDKVSNREKSMRLAEMRDIAGARVILKDMQDLKAFLSLYKNKTRLKHRQVITKDYIEQPKISGYRGVHIIFEYNGREANSEKAGQYAGLKVEVQVRTALQHLWATSVEVAGLVVGKSYKTMSIDDDWAIFFKYFSSLLALLEKQPILEEHINLSPNEIARKVLALEEKLHVVSRMRSLAEALSVGKIRNAAPGYLLMTLDIQEKSLYVTHYPKNKIAKADKDYRILERQNEQHPWVNSVLVSVSDLRRVKEAYPNYILDVKRITEILTSLKEANASL